MTQIQDAKRLNPEPEKHQKMAQGKRHSIHVIFLFCLFLYGTWPTLATAAVSKWLPIGIHNGHLSIPISVEGVPATAMLDTGASTHSISPRFINEHDLSLGRGASTNVAGVVELRRVTSHNNVQIEFYGAPLELDRVTEASTAPFDMILGIGLFNATIIQIDYPGKRMRFLDHDSFDHRKTPNMKMKREKWTGLPIVRVNLNDDKDAWIILDTGNAGGLLVSNELADKYDWVGQYGSGKSYGAGTHGVTASFDTFLLPRVEFGPFALPNVKTSTPAKGQSLQLSRTLDDLASRSGHVKSRIRKKGSAPVGLLGYEVLRHFVVTIDYQHTKLRLDMNEQELATLDYDSLIGEPIGKLFSEHGQPQQKTDMEDDTRSYYWLLTAVGKIPASSDSGGQSDGTLSCEIFASTNSYGTILEIDREGNGC